MQTIIHSTRGLGVMVHMNLDRILFFGMLAGSLWAGTWFASH